MNHRVAVGPPVDESPRNRVAWPTDVVGDLRGSEAQVLSDPASRGREDSIAAHEERDAECQRDLEDGERVRVSTENNVELVDDEEDAADHERDPQRALQVPWPATEAQRLPWRGPGRPVKCRRRAA